MNEVIKSIGFTGTSKHGGMTDQQKRQLESMLDSIKRDSFLNKSTLIEAHHGDCVGADVQFDEIARLFNFFTIAHPASDTGAKRAHCNADKVLDAKPALIRNRDIVDASMRMFATPARYKEELRSGTWAAIRYCKKVQKPLIIIWPDGSTTVYNLPDYKKEEMH